MIKIKGGRKVLYQWDLNQSIILDNVFIGAQVHFSDEHNTKDTCPVLLAYEENGQVLADIPNIFLQKSGIITVYIYTKKENEEHTEYFSELLVLPRKKPDDYVYTETEIKRWEDLEQKVIDGIGYYSPSVDANGNLSWIANNDNFPAVEAVNIKGVKGEVGPQGEKGEDGYTPVKGVDYFTDAEKSEMIQAVLDALPAAEGVSY